ncbi:hypothetical protein EJV47_23305 [Hymenobacter gummosus]|uniref:DUF6443 domain-containing protein n=1 Tax=Hymenobacter gummosus TaxID=1776032 RepID=A0A431TX37_9BACT|nr:DUF6443 domain-containing protein [Hymenobacter gummosus]RTQ46082.1 hypothetical protein EJV47_23305 [Hymenobacter gummosus]
MLKCLLTACRPGTWLAVALLSAGIITPGMAQSTEGLVPDSTELRVLRQFYHHTGGPAWASHGTDHWLEPVNRLSDVNTWLGVYVYNGDIAHISLPSNGLRGDLPDCLSELRQLRHLNLAENQLAGSLPTTFGELQYLISLNLASNKLTGPLPAAWHALRQLNQLYLGQNRLAGAIPNEWGRLQQLAYFQAGNNMLSGPLPDSLSRCTNLVQLGLSYNQLSGTLPVSWSGLASTLDLDDNRLTGSIPAAWGQGVLRYRLNLARNKLTGTIPDGLRARFLLLQDNRLSGRLPDSFATAWPQQGIWQLFIDNNDLTGIPGFSSPLGYPDLQVGLTNNYLQFDSYEANLTNPGSGQYQYFDNGQRTPAAVDTQYVVAGTRAWLRRPFGGSHNHYQWQRKIGMLWVDVVPGPDADALLLPGASEAVEGEYRVKVSNDWLPWMTLYSAGLYVSILPYSIAARNEPNDSSPPGPLDAFEPADRTGAVDSVNYVRTYIARAPYTNPQRLRQAVVDSVQTTTEYLDGLGRALQTVGRQESPARRDVVQPRAYDAQNRQPRQYLPFSAAGGSAQNGAYRPNALREQYNFYRNPASAAMLPTGVPFAETGFEASPRGQVLGQASPGETWRFGALENHTVAYLERTNRASEDTVRRWTPGYGTEREDLVLDAQPYPDGSLWVKQTTDEQGQMSREFTDLEGRVVLKQVAQATSGQRTSWLNTYYIYDDFGRLRAVLPPRAVQLIRRHQWQVDGAGVERLLFRYHYDEQGRLVEKLVPDTDGYQYTVYNELDQPVLVQDAAQRTRAEWVATKYDASGRPVLTALVTRPGQTRADLAAEAARASAPQWEEHSSAAATAAELGHYSDRAFPRLRANGQLQAGTQLLTLNHFDSYDFDRNGSADASYATQYDAQLGGAAAAPDLRVTGQPTRTQVRVLGVAASNPGAWQTTVTFYDDKARPIQVQSSNARGQQDVLTTRYDWSGKPLVSYSVHQGPNHAPVSVRETSFYDHTGRLLETRQELDGGDPVTIAANAYNELGQLEQKKLGGSVAQTALQTVDYRYNVRGWLTHVNDARLTPQANQRPDLFGLELCYDYGFRQNQFNGNIAGQKWRTASDQAERAYGYRYDLLSRVMQGDFVARDAAGTWNAERDNYRFWAASYDANGNLLTMRRRGLVQEASRTTPRRYGEIDNLRYRYQPDASTPISASNRLLRVDDLAPVATVFGSAQPTRPDFQDGATTGSPQPDYAYDVVGSLTRDQNKGIDSIRYNHLHLPTHIVWHNGNKLEFRYTAAGQKVAKLATEAGKPTIRTDYLGPWQYEGDSLRWLTTSEGRALRFVQRDAAGQARTRYTYEFTIKDHLGNLRIAFRPGDSATYRASMEPALADQEEAQFDYVRETRFQTADAAGGHHVARLNAAAGTPIGPLKMIPVRKGDEIGVEAFGRYFQPARNTNYGFSLLGFVASLLQQPVAPPAPGDGRSRIRPLPFLGIGLAMVPQLTQLSNGVPKGYLRVLVFDKDSSFITSYTQQLTSAAATGYQRLTVALTVPKDGYVQAYVGNESDANVYFDDISIRYKPTLVVQENHYDPFGLDLAGLAKNASNKYLYNSTELQNEFGLSWNHYGARMYDAQVGRWATTDPMTESYFSFGPYNYVRNNPLLRMDPTGQWDITVHTYKDRSKYGYGVAVVTDCNGKEVYRFNVRVEGTGGRDRKVNKADTPTGVYDIPNKNMWTNADQAGFIAAGSPGTEKELQKNRDSYGPNPRLQLNPLTGEIVDTGRDLIRVHGGQQEKFDPRTGKWTPVKNPQLVRTWGCIRAFDADMVRLKAITDNLQKNNPDELGGVLKVVDDLEPHVEQSTDSKGKSSWTTSYLVPGEYSADKNPEQFKQLLKDLFPNWNRK